MAKTVFSDNVTIINADWLNKVFDHAHDGVDDDGHAPDAHRTGEIIMYAWSSLPSGFLLCDGSAVSRTTYAALFAIISTTYGVGNGSTTFNLPDLRGRCPVGVGRGSGLRGRNLGDSAGEEDHTLTEAEMPAHKHSVHEHSNSEQEILRPSRKGYGATSGSSGGGQPHNNMQPFLAIYALIRT